MLAQSCQSNHYILHLLIPELFAHYTSETFTKLRLEALERLLSRAYKEEWAYSEWRSSLFALFDLPSKKPLPIAPITHLYDTNESNDKIWLRADPVHLCAKRDHIVLFDTRSAFTVTQTEANILINEINQLYKENTLTFSAPTPTRWYVALPDLPKLTLYPLSDVIGKNIRDYMPKGKDQWKWRQILNEIQMLLHQSPVNTDRQARGELPINSVWFWGLGQLPAKPQSRWTHVWSDDPLVQGLARLTNTPQTALPVTGTDWLAHLTPGEHLLTLIPSWQNFDSWKAWLNYLEQAWFTPLFEALKRRQIDTVALYLDENCIFVITETHIRHWWRYWWQRRQFID